MSNLHFDRLWAFLAGLQPAVALLWLGLAAFTVGLAILMYSRWGQNRPLRKCMALSLLAHLLLAGYSTTIEIISPVPPPAEHVFRVSFQEDGSAIDSATRVAGGTSVAKGQEQPWEIFPSDAVAQPKEASLERRETAALAEPERSVRAEDAKLAGEVVRDHLPLVAIQPPEPKAPPARESQTRTAPGEAAASIDAPVAQRREAVQPMLQHIAASTEREIESPTLQPVRSASDDVPAALIEAPMPLPAIVENTIAAANSPMEMSVANANPVRAEPIALRSIERVGKGATDDDPVYVAAAKAANRSESHDAGSDGLASMSNGTSGRESDVPRHAARGAGTPTLDRSRDGAADGAENVIPDAYRLRMAPDHTDVAEHQGGSAETEAAVKAALKWFADHQAADGRWNPRDHGAGRETNVMGHDHQGAGSRADTGVTGLALLTFLASGHTHRDGPYQEDVRRGLQYLMQAQAQDGSLGGQAALFEFMYCHAMAACALSEAYGMTHDERLRGPVERAIAYTVAAQDPVGGGWRYRAGTPGDTSQLGWQLMALKSADLAGIPISGSTRQGVIRYLRSVSSGKYGGKASYRPGEQVSRTMSAEALVCWQFLGLPREHPACGEAGDLLLGELPGEGLCNLYYWYYATLAMYQLQEHHWERWNEALRKTLVNRQIKDGPMAGSWEGDDLWGSHGGRLYSTALATLSLEVYYRFLPLYSGVSTAKSRTDLQSRVK